MPRRKRLPTDRLALILLLLPLAGCIDRLPEPMMDPALGSAMDVPVRVVTGRGSSVEAALADARRQGGGEADGVRLVSAERRAYCLPLCDYPLFRWERVTVTAQLVKSPRVKDKDDEARGAERLSIGEAPPAQALETRLEHLYASDPSGAGTFYESLDGESRGELRDIVLSQTGRLNAAGSEFLVDAALPAERRAFAAWFVGRYTNLQPR